MGAALPGRLTSLRHGDLKIFNHSTVSTVTHQLTRPHWPRQDLFCRKSEASPRPAAGAVSTLCGRVDADNQVTERLAHIFPAGVHHQLGTDEAVPVRGHKIIVARKRVLAPK